MRTGTPNMAFVIFILIRDQTTSTLRFCTEKKKSFLFFLSTCFFHIVLPHVSPFRTVLAEAPDD